ncbi:MAG: TonB family protein [Betaproteobacteria bacterium]|nr:TonB family protein [Betaproteobacteria bacterium]
MPAPAARDEPRRPASAAATAERFPAGAAAPDTGAAHAVDEDGLRQLRFALAGAAQKFKRYPMVAQERGWSGSVDVRIAFFGDGRAPAVSVARSSSHEIPDRQAREMVLQALTIVTLPPGVAGREFATEVEVRFDLRLQ